MRFVMVDRIVDLVPGKLIRTIKNVSSSEDYFNDHFPGLPIMPGALILECIIQSAILMLSAGEGFAYQPVVTRIPRAAFKHFVRPGDQLMVRCEAHDRGVVLSSAVVEGLPVAEVRVEIARGPDLAADNPIRRMYDALKIDPNELVRRIGES